MSEDDQETFSLEQAPPRDPASTADRLSYTNYALANTIRNSNGQVEGRFSPSFTGACTNPFPSWIAESAIINWEQVGNCPGGRVPVIRFNHY